MENSYDDSFTMSQRRLFESAKKKKKISPRKLYQNVNSLNDKPQPKTQHLGNFSHMK